MAEESKDIETEGEEVKVDPSVKAPELYAAAKLNDVATVTLLLKEEVSPLFVDDCSGWTALHWAVKHNNKAMTKKLLEYGASEPYHELVQKKELDTQNSAPESKTSEEISPEDKEEAKEVEAPKHDLLKNTPLLWAAFKGYVHILWLLLLDGYSPNDVDSLNNNAVHLAAAGGHKSILQCLIDDGGNANAVNIYLNVPVNMATNAEIREMLTTAMEKGASMSKADVAQKHEQNIKTYKRMTSELSNVISQASKVAATGTGGNLSQAIRELSDMLQVAKERSLDVDLIAEGEELLVRLEQIVELSQAIANLKQHSPLSTQTEYIDYVHTLERVVALAASTGVNSDQVDLANELISKAQMEYWVSMRIVKLKDVERAADHNEHDMESLRKVISKVSGFDIDGNLMSRAISLLRRLDSELEITRALLAVPVVRLPPPEPIEGYWTEDDIGALQEFEGFPLLPPEMTEYAWDHSKSYLALEASIDRLKRATTNTDPATNQAALAEAKDKITSLEKDMRVLEAKDMQDKQAAVEVAEKAAKKLKKASKKKKPAK